MPHSPSSRDAARFGDLSFEDFRRLAGDAGLSRAERIGFPDGYREGREAAILADIATKLPALDEQGRIVIDIGPGCSELPDLLRARCAEHGHTLVFVDCAEMLAHHPPGPGFHAVAARFPDCPELLDRYAGRAHAVLAYSVLQYAFVDASPFAFVDAALSLLAPGGRLLLGDLPNASMRKRFLASAAGAEHHRAYTGRDEAPDVRFNVLEPGQPDDAVVLALLARARAAGFDAWVLPQAPELPMANRREDVLIHRP